MNVAVILPVLNPDEKFTAFVNKLVSSGYQNIVVVNDGSAPEYVHFFDEAAVHPQIRELI